MKQKLKSEYIGRYEIQPQANGQFRVLTSSGVGLGLFNTHREAQREVDDFMAMDLLVKNEGKERAIELLRQGWLQAIRESHWGK